MEYNTKQKEAALALLKERGAAMSAAQVARELPEVGRSTVYRILSHLAREGLAAVSISGRERLFSYVGSCASHLHGSCRSCGALVHMDAEASRRIEEALLSQGLEPSPDGLIPCLCAKCREAGR